MSSLPITSCEEKLIKASEMGDLINAKELIDNGTSVNTQTKDGRSVLYLSIYNGNYNVAQLLLDHKANINFYDNYGWPALLMSTKHGHMKVVQFLVKHGADIHANNNYYEMTALADSISK